MSFKVNFKSKKVKMGIGIFIIVVLSIGFVVSKKNKVGDVEPEETGKFIETYSIPDNEKIFINGSIIPKESKDISLEAGYEIYSLNVSNGQSVKKGDVIFTARSSENLSQIKELEQQVKDLKNNSESDKESSDTSTKSEILKLDGEIKSLKNKSYMTVYAPFSGKVYMNENKSSKEEEMPSYMTIESNQYYMKGQVSEQDLPKLRQSIPVNIHVFATEEKLRGQISSISERPSSGVEEDGEVAGSSLSYYDVCVEFDSQENFKNVFHIQATVEVKNKNPKVPISALKKDKDGYFVYKVVGGRLSKQTIEVESQTEDFAVLRSGLIQKDTIIKCPTDEMKEGDEVQVDSMSMEKSPNDGDAMNTTEEKVGM